MANYASIQGQSSRGADTIARRGRAHKDGGGEATMFSSIVNILNTILGAGILAMPFVLSQMGMLLGLIVIVWSSLASGFGLYLQSRCARYLDRGTSSFYAIAQLTYPNAAVIFDLAIAIKCFGVGVSYLIIIGDLMPGVVEGIYGAGVSWASRELWITVFMIPVLILSFMKKLDSLRHTSMVALMAIVYLVILVLYHFAADPLEDKSELRVITWAGAIPALRVFPVVVFAYTCHQNMFSVLNEIKNNSPSSILGVIGTSAGSACSLYILIAITGYLTFGNNVLSNIISQYPNGNGAIFGKAAIVVLEMFSVPLQVHPCRNSVDGILKWISQRWSPKPRNERNRSVSPGGRPLLGRAANTPRDDHSPAEMSDLRFALITTFILVASYALSLRVHSLDTMLAFVGATGSTSISFILPGLFYYKISDPESIHHQRLIKDDDDADADEEDTEDADDETTAAMAASVASLASVGGTVPGRSRLGRALRTLDPERIEPKILRRLSLSLAVYGAFVAVVCLTMNLVFRIQGH